ncbi:hypothetical protein RUM43_000477 [Polyplax serrata]|uniref:Uncharacterized protein n=1 Tax=Polyplax serrata TaxID=468196 RepID=A0AAN8SH50_POLSC
MTRCLFEGWKRWDVAPQALEFAEIRPKHHTAQLNKVRVDYNLRTECVRQPFFKFFTSGLVPKWRFGKAIFSHTNCTNG